MQKTADKEAVSGAAASGNLWTHFYIGSGYIAKNDQVLHLGTEF